MDKSFHTASKSVSNFPTKKRHDNVVCNKQALSRCIVAIKNSNGLSSTDVYKTAGIPKQTWHDYFSGNTCPTRKNLKKLFLGLHCTPEQQTTLFEYCGYASAPCDKNLLSRVLHDSIESHAVNLAESKKTSLAIARRRAEEEIRNEACIDVLAWKKIYNGKSCPNPLNARKLAVGLQCKFGEAKDFLELCGYTFVRESDSDCRLQCYLKECEDKGRHLNWWNAICFIGKHSASNKSDQFLKNQSLNVA